MWQTWPIALSQVVKTVYASPSRVNFQLDSKKASVAFFVIYHQGEIKQFFLYILIILLTITPSWTCLQEVETTPAYPDICFAIDDFDSTFDAVVIYYFSKLFQIFNHILCIECIQYPISSVNHIFELTKIGISLENIYALCCWFHVSKMLA